VLADREGTPAVVIVNPDAVAIGKRIEQRFQLGRIERHYDVRTFVEGSRNALLNRLAASAYANYQV